MIPKTIHQIFWDYSGEGKPLTEFDVFHKCHTKALAFCKEYGFDHVMWRYEDCENLLKDHYPKYLEMWQNFPQPVMKGDFIRYIILYHHGGIYMDMDMYPVKDFTALLSNKELFTTWHDDKRKLPYYALMLSEKNNPLFKEIAEHSEESYYEKIKLPIYEKWTGRLVFQTTGHFMIKRVIKKYNIIPGDYVRVYTKNNRVVEGDDVYWEDFNASVWYKPNKA